MEEEDNVSTNRRNLLKAFGAGSLTGLAGCNGTDDENSAGTNSSGRGNSSSTLSDQAPQILSTTAEPQNNGKALSVSMEAEDDEDLQYTLIQYGDVTEERENIEGRKIDMNGRLTGLTGAQPDKEPGQVLYLARDNQGQETRIETSPDETAPRLLDFAAEPTGNAGEISLTVQGKDNSGLEQLALLLDGNPQLQKNVSGQKETAVDTTIDLSDDATVGEENNLTAMLEDWNGNTTESESDTYVRKFDKMDDTRLSFGAVYQPYFREFTNEGLNMEGRVPTIGQYDPPYHPEVFNRHVDQMRGHGISRLMLEFGSDGYVKEEDERFLDSEAISEMKVEPFYSFLGNWWGEGYAQSAENYRKELLEPDMTWARDNILSRENASTHDGRPVMQMWNPNTLALDYQHDKIMDEFGSYESFVDEMRALLSVDGRDPYLVGGANSYGASGYTDRGEEIHKQFDAVTTWTAGGAWQDNEDNETTKEEVLEFVEDNFQGHREFTEERNVDFVPMVFPGFNEAKDPGRRHPRSPELFEEILELAEEYRTTDMVNSSVYNNWEEMTALEPGKFEEGPFGDESYGTAYLDIVEEFQQP